MCYAADAMNRWSLFLFAVFLAGCSVLPEDGPVKKHLRGTLTFREMTALPTTAVAHVVIVPVQATADTKPIAQGDFPARTGTSIPFDLKFSEEKIASGGEYLVLAQVLDHDKVWFSNLSSPLRISFLAEPGEVTIELRREKF
jgi:uncharacterized lipoprotein YbaY